LWVPPISSGASYNDERSHQQENEGFFSILVSGNLGFADAFDNNFNGFQPVLTGTFEYYSSPRVSWRGLLGSTSFDADRPRGADVDFMFVNANLTYNWEGGWTHPFVTGGVGLYSKDASSSLPSKAGDTVPGLNFGGGLDWFLGSRWALKFEGTFHALTGEKPNSFLLGTAGVKWWF